jgi:hypothetical protein
VEKILSVKQTITHLTNSLRDSSVSGPYMKSSERMPKFVYVVGLALPNGVVADRRSGDRITLTTGLLVT